MAVSFIFVAIVVSFMLLAVAFCIRNWVIGMLSGMMICCLGIYIAIYDIETLSNLLTNALGLILTALGAYVFINTGKEKIEELM